MYKKFFAWSFDDGLEQDKKIVEILKQYNMGGTFHLNSGLFGDKTYISRISNLGILETPVSKFNTNKWHLLPYGPHFRIPEDEVCRVYEGFEIAAHSRTHKNLAKCSDTERRQEISEDVAALSEKFRQTVTGFAYPYGALNTQCIEDLKAAGVQYARTAKTTDDFRFPENPLEMPMTCWHISGKTFEKLDRFFAEEPTDDDRFFLMFAHGYEFDFGTKESNWDKFQRICERVSGHDDIVCCSIGEAFRRHAEQK